MNIISKVKEVFTKEYKEETEYREFINNHKENFKFQSDNYEVDRQIEIIKNENNDNKNEQYADLLEKAAERLKKLKSPISYKTIDAIEEVSRSIIEEGNREEIIESIERYPNLNISYMSEQDAKIIFEEIEEEKKNIIEK